LFTAEGSIFSASTSPTSKNLLRGHFKFVETVQVVVEVDVEVVVVVKTDVIALKIWLKKIRFSWLPSSTG
jgi:hypothetical protein